MSGQYLTASWRMLHLLLLKKKEKRWIGGVQRERSSVFSNEVRVTLLHHRIVSSATRQCECKWASEVSLCPPFDFLLFLSMNAPLRGTRNTALLKTTCCTIIFVQRWKNFPESICCIRSGHCIGSFNQKGNRVCDISIEMNMSNCKFDI